MKYTCGACYAWCKVGGPDLGEATGECHLNPPVVMIVPGPLGNPSMANVYPVLKSTTPCCMKVITD